jgi:hypothetical protein
LTSKHEALNCPSTRKEKKRKEGRGRKEGGKKEKGKRSTMRN